MIINKHKGEFMFRELAALNAVGGAEHAQWILLSGVTNTRASLCVVSNTLGHHTSVNSGESCALL